MERCDRIVVFVFKGLAVTALSGAIVFPLKVIISNLDRLRRLVRVPRMKLTDTACSRCRTGNVRKRIRAYGMSLGIIRRRTQVNVRVLTGTLAHVVAEF